MVAPRNVPLKPCDLRYAKQLNMVGAAKARGLLELCCVEAQDIGCEMLRPADAPQTRGIGRPARLARMDETKLAHLGEDPPGRHVVLIDAADDGLPTVVRQAGPPAFDRHLN